MRGESVKIIMYICIYFIKCSKILQFFFSFFSPKVLKSATENVFTCHDLGLFCVFLVQPLVARKEASALSVAHRLRRDDLKSETNANGSEIQPENVKVSLQVNYYSSINPS